MLDLTVTLVVEEGEKVAYIYAVLSGRIVCRLTPQIPEAVRRKTGCQLFQPAEFTHAENRAQSLVEGDLARLAIFDVQTDIARLLHQQISFDPRLYLAGIMDNGRLTLLAYVVEVPRPCIEAAAQFTS